MTISRMTTFGSAAALAAITATSTRAATVNPFEMTNIDNGYSMLGDQAPNSDWVINPVKNDETGAVMCVGSLKLNDSVVADANGATLSEAEIDALDMNARYIMVTPTANGETENLIRTGFPATDISLGGADIVANPDVANDAVFADAIPSTIEATSYSVYDNSTFVPHTFSDEVVEFPQQAFDDCNTNAANGEFDAEFKTAERDALSIISFEVPTDETIPNSLSVTYASTFIPATGAVEAEYSTANGLETFESCDLISADENGIRVSQSVVRDVFGGSVSGCTQQTKPVCADVQVQDGEINVRQCVPEELFSTTDDGFAIAVANASAVSVATGGGFNNTNNGGSSFGGIAIGGVSIGGSSTGDTFNGDIFEDNSITGDVTNIFEGDVTTITDITDITNIFTDNSTVTNICSNNVENGPGNQYVCPTGGHETVAPVPIPPALPLLALGLGALALAGRRKSDAPVPV